MIAAGGVRAWHAFEADDVARNVMLTWRTDDVALQPQAEWHAAHAWHAVAAAADDAAAAVIAADAATRDARHAHALSVR